MKTVSSSCISMRSGGRLVGGGACGSLFSYQSVYFTDLFAYFCARNVTKSAFSMCDKYIKENARQQQFVCICVRLCLYIYLCVYSCLSSQRRLKSLCKNTLPSLSLCLASRICSCFCCCCCCLPVSSKYFANLFYYI